MRIHYSHAIYTGCSSARRRARRVPPPSGAWLVVVARCVCVAKRRGAKRTRRGEEGRVAKKKCHERRKLVGEQSGRSYDLLVTIVFCNCLPIENVSQSHVAKKTGEKKRHERNRNRRRAEKEFNTFQSSQIIPSVATAQRHTFATVASRARDRRRHIKRWRTK